MSIERGKPWGTFGALPDNGVLVHSDAEAADVVARALGRGEDPPPLGLLGGDLCRTLGGRGDEARLHRHDAARLEVDLLFVTLDGGPEIPVVAHVVIRGRSWLFGAIDAAMNGAWIRRWNVAPRAHPGDGTFDTITATLSLGDRLKARRRLPLGTHVPHPAIKTRRVTTATFQSPRPRGVWCDGVRVGVARNVSVRVETDRLHVVV